MSDKIIIREAENNSKDLKQIEDLVKYLMQVENAENIESNVQKIMQDRIMPAFDHEIGKIFVAEHKNKIVGFLLVELKFNLVASLAFTAINPIYQRQGIGTKLVDAVIKFSKSKNVHIISVLIDKENNNSKAFHEKIGFKLFGYSLRKEI
ncbi:MAG: GNAT family N-acetyltransferase [bacterium]